MSLIIMEFIQSKEQKFKFKYYSFIFIIDYEHRNKLDNLRHIINNKKKNLNLNIVLFFICIY